MSKQKSNNSAIGFPILLGLAFIVLKLCKQIDWSWWWILSPFWVGPSIIIIALLVIWTIGYLKRKKLRR